MAHKWVRECCPKVDGYYQNEYGAWVETGKIGNQPVRSERHAEHMAMERAWRTAVQNGDVDQILDLKFKG